MGGGQGGEGASVGSAAALAERFRGVREQSERLAAPLSDEDQGVQSMPDASPTKWHLAHTSWFFETFLLEGLGEAPFDPDFRFLFNSYYHGVGAMHARPRRGLLTRPSCERVRAYRHHVDDAMRRALEVGRFGEDALALVELGIQHEQQHQELLLTDILHAFSCNPLWPSYSEKAKRAALAKEDAPVGWLGSEGGLVEVGAPGGGEAGGFGFDAGFAFDNERPRHRVYLEPFELADRPVSCGDVLRFMQDGGYARHELWLSEGWDAVGREGWRAPFYWREGEEGWDELTLHGPRKVEAARPAVHLSYFEADAIARHAGARLPTEAEWEAVAREHEPAGNLLECGALETLPASAPGSQLFGDVWEWTASPYVAYPGFRPAAGAVGEYNGKFMCNQMVLRGGSFATPASHIRASYRNFFPAHARWQFSGARLARDA